MPGRSPLTVKFRKHLRQSGFIYVFLAFSWLSVVQSNTNTQFTVCVKGVDLSDLHVWFVLEVDYMHKLHLLCQATIVGNFVSGVTHNKLCSHQTLPYCVHLSFLSLFIRTWGPFIWPVWWGVCATWASLTCIRPPLEGHQVQITVPCFLFHTHFGWDSVDLWKGHHVWYIDQFRDMLILGCQQQSFLC